VSHPRFHKNVPGPFYSTGECTACTLPESEAPDLLARLDDENSDTYFIRQPETQAEIERACLAARVCCVDAIRYGGTDQNIILLLGNRPEHCDHLLPGGPVRLPGENDSSWAAALAVRGPWWKFWAR
jgi:4Fe-4S single cluster domain of Ferredoxin I